MNEYLIINATLVTSENKALLFEFVVNLNLQVVECGKIVSVAEQSLRVIPDLALITDCLFEVNHIRIDPMRDNQQILHNLRQALEDSGVQIVRKTSLRDMRVLYNPVGELDCIVRFRITAAGEIIFMTPKVKLKVLS